jgi:hemolysin activation/secretion protein
MLRGTVLRASAAGAALAAALMGSAVARAQEASAVAPAPTAAAHFLIRAFQVKGNRWLPPSEVEDLVYPYMGPDRTADDVEKARVALQGAFEKKGYATVSVTLPEQSVDSGIIRLEVESQAIGQVTASGTKHPNKVLAQAASLQPGEVPNFKAVQADVVALNMSSDRRVTPEVKAGAAPGTVDVNLKVEQSSPFHGSLELNNYSSPSTSNLRLSGTLRYDDLWGRGDSISVSVQTPPRREKDGTVVSANYLAHLGKLQALAYYVHSDSDIGIVGGTTVIGKGDLAGMRLILPLSQSESFYQSLTAGIDYKNFKEDVALGADRSSAPIEYFPVTAGWRGDWTSGHNKSFLSLSATLGLRGLGDDQAVFDFKRYKARPNFFYLRGEGSVTQDIWRSFQLYGHLTGQYSDNPLVSNEEFSIGGSDSVRGYLESETLGDSGVAGQFELRSPALLKGLPLLDELRLLGFVDSGYSRINFPLAGQIDHQWLSSVGGGVRIKFRKYLNGSVDVGVPLKDGPDTRSGDVFTRFRIWGEF